MGVGEESAVGQRTGRGTCAHGGGGGGGQRGLYFVTSAAPASPGGLQACHSQPEERACHYASVSLHVCVCVCALHVCTSVFSMPCPFSVCVCQSCFLSSAKSCHATLCLSASLHRSGSHDRPSHSFLGTGVVGGGGQPCN